MGHRLVSYLLMTALCMTAVAQSSQRFPAPLGLDRVLIGTVSKASTKDQSRPKDARKKAQYLLSSEGQSYSLNGHEAELKKLVGKKVRVTGNAIGNELTVNSVERAEQ